jgi:hypothetical protein
MRFFRRGSANKLIEFASEHSFAVRRVRKSFALAFGGKVALTEAESRAIFQDPRFPWEKTQRANPKLFAEEFVRSDEMSPKAMARFRKGCADWEARDQAIASVRKDFEVPVRYPRPHLGQVPTYHV